MIDHEEIKHLQTWNKEQLALLIDKSNQKEIKILREENEMLKEQIKQLKELKNDR
jgi:cell division protein FtsB